MWRLWSRTHGAIRTDHLAKRGHRDDNLRAHRGEFRELHGRARQHQPHTTTPIRRSWSRQGQTELNRDGLGADSANFVATRADLGADGAGALVDIHRPTPPHHAPVLEHKAQPPPQMAPVLEQHAPVLAQIAPRGSSMSTLHDFHSPGIVVRLQVWSAYSISPSPILRRFHGHPDSSVESFDRPLRKPIDLPFFLIDRL